MHAVNHLKCAFEVSYKKYLRVHSSRKKIDLDLDKARAIHNMEPPTTCKQLQNFMWRVTYMHRFSTA